MSSIMFSHAFQNIPSDKTNVIGLLLLQLVGIDGNLTTFPIAYALLLSQTQDTFWWVFEQFQAAAGSEICRVVEWNIGDEDPGQVAALDRSKVGVFCLSTMKALSRCPYLIMARTQRPIRSRFCSPCPCIFIMCDVFVCCRISSPMLPRGYVPGTKQQTFASHFGGRGPQKLTIITSRKSSGGW